MGLVKGALTMLAGQGLFRGGKSALGMAWRHKGKAALLGSGIALDQYQNDGALLSGAADKTKDAAGFLVGEAVEFGLEKFLGVSPETAESIGDFVSDYMGPIMLGMGSLATMAMFGQSIGLIAAAGMAYYFYKDKIYDAFTSAADTLQEHSPALVEKTSLVLDQAKETVSSYIPTPPSPAGP